MSSELQRCWMSGTYNWSSVFRALQHSHNHAIAVWVPDNQLAFMAIVATSHNHVMAIWDLPCQLSPSKINGDAPQFLHTILGPSSLASLHLHASHIFFPWPLQHPLSQLTCGLHWASQGSSLPSLPGTPGASCFTTLLSWSYEDNWECLDFCL